MLTQLTPPIPLDTPKGKAWAIALIDYGPQWDLQWVTFIHGTGECWTFTNRDVRQEENMTFHIPKPSPLYQKPALDGAPNGHAVNGMDGETPMRPASLNGRH
jgi:hypothetical protein